MKRQRILVLSAVICALIGPAPPVALSAYLLPDSDEKSCWDVGGNLIPCAGTGQDGAYSINPMSVTVNTGATAGTVTDNNTELMWQQGGTGVWYTQSSAQAYCTSLLLGGFDDWRLPTRFELLSILDYNIPAPGPLFPSGFANLGQTYMWTSTAGANNPGLYAWDGFVCWGNVASADRGTPMQVRCVRGTETTGPNWTINDSLTATDSRTGLAWQRNEPGAKSWPEALTYCESLSQSGSTSWRLPNVKELGSIIDDKVHGPAVDKTIFPSVVSENYWTSTSYPAIPTYLWAVDMTNGYVQGYNKGAAAIRVRCVCDGITPPSGWRLGETTVTWKNTNWFGNYNLTSATAVTHEQHGSLTVTYEEPSGGGVCFNDPVLGGNWCTRSEYYPWISRTGTTPTQWLYYIKGSTNPRQFWDVTAGSWLFVPPPAP